MDIHSCLSNCLGSESRSFEIKELNESDYEKISTFMDYDSIMKKRIQC